MELDPAIEAAGVIRNFVPRVPRAQLVGYLKQTDANHALHFLVTLVEELEDGSQKEVVEKKASEG